MSLLEGVKKTDNPSPGDRTPDHVDYGREVVRQEVRALEWIIQNLDDRFCRATELILACEGQVVLTGMGKAGLIARKVSATLASTGTLSQFLHPAEAIHGDLGRVRPKDVVIALSNSGETEELRRLIDPVKRIGAPLIAVTSATDSTLAEHADLVLEIGKEFEACPIGLAPTTSTTAMLAVCDALSMAVSKARSFSREEFALFHPAGALGRKLLRVGEIMRKGENHTVVTENERCCDVLERINQTPGRPGAASVVNADGVLVGFITDGDIVRRLTSDNRDFLDEPVSKMMTPNPKIVMHDNLTAEAQHVMQEKRVDQLPVVDADGRPVGLIDVQDLLDLGKG